MKNQPDFEHPALLVAELIHRFPRRKRMSLTAIEKRFHALYGKRCSQWMVWRGIAALLDQTNPDWRERAAVFERSLKNPPESTRS